MNKRLGDLTIRNLMICYVLLYTIMPIVQRLTSRFLTAYFYMAVVALLVFLIMILDRFNILGQSETFLIPFIIYGLLTYFYTRENFLMWGYQVILFLLPVLLAFYFTQNESSISTSYSKLIIIAVMITMITTIIGCIRNPSAARILATVDAQDEESYIYDMQNIGGYSFVYYIVLLYPILILSYKTRKITLLPTLIISLIFLITIIYSEYTTALLLFIVSSLLFLTNRNLSVKGIIIISILLVLFLLFFSSVIEEFLKWLGSAAGSETVASRLNALSGGRSGLENSEDKRLELYQFSLNNFLRNPLFGTLFESYKVNGGHSFIFDSLSSYGLLGGAIIIFMYKNIFNKLFLPFKERTGFGYIVWFFIQTIILSIINTGMWLDVLCLFAPILLHWVYGDEDTSKEYIAKKQNQI